MAYYRSTTAAVISMKMISLAVVFALGPFFGAFAQDAAMQRLENSPRHHEWVTIPQGEREVRAFVAYPESDEPTSAVIVIHENRGLSDWVRSVADRLAEEGYVAIAPDLLSQMGPEGGSTSDFPDSDAARDALYALDPDQITADLSAVADYIIGLSSTSDKLFVAGFCWGGSQTFRFATNRSGLEGSFVFYGSAPDDPAAIARIDAPVYGFYGGDDARINSGIPQTRALMDQAGNTYEVEIYEGAGHAFLKRGLTEDEESSNAVAMSSAWSRWLALLN